ncbi:MAG: DUF975 family protein [Hespellia sp.]|nr:DUF975 family protein [Hespellia sp.]
MWNRVDLKMRGKAAFQKNYWSCVAVAFIMSIITTIATGSNGRAGSQGIWQDHSYHHYYGYGSGFTFFAAFLTVIVVIIAIGLAMLGIFVGNVLKVGGCQFFVENQTMQARVQTIFEPFKSGQYVNLVVTMFLMHLFTVLWTMLFVVPGIIKMYEYRMIPYILAENPGMNRQEAFAISKRMMMGKKWETFVLDLSFIGWWILSACTCGILGIFFVMPYVQATNAEIYTANRAIAYNEGYIR